MSDQDNIFNSDPQKTNNEDPNVDPSKNPTNADPQYDFIGEGKKYASVDEALKSVPHAQSHIQNLEDELAKLREANAKSTTLDDVLNKINTAKTSEPAHQPAQELDVDKLVETIESKLTAKEVAKHQQDNIDTVISKMSEVYGDKAEAEFLKAAQDSGLSVQDMNRLAAASPEAVYKLTGIGVDKGSKTPDMSNGSVNTDSFNKNNQDDGLNIKVPAGATSKDITNAWLNAGKAIERS